MTTGILGDSYGVGRMKKFRAVGGGGAVEHDHGEWVRADDAANLLQAARHASSIFRRRDSTTYERINALALLDRMADNLENAEHAK